ncbi:hypothetical protein D3C80_881030 [compost metagenome]
MVEASISGTNIVSESSFGVLAAKTTGYVNPPSTDNFIFTFADPESVLVLFTVHITVCADPFAHPRLSSACDVTANGPAAAVTVTTIASVLVCAIPSAALSRPVSVKFIVFAIEETDSQLVVS